MLLLEIITLTPFAMKLLGKKLFWPSKKVTAHKDSKVWFKASSAATKHPIISIVIVLLLILPTVIFGSEKLNFDTISELGDSHSSSKAINLVSDHFGKGQAMPATIVIKNTQAMDNNDALTVIDTLTERVKKIDGVKMVASVTQPQSTQIEGFYIGSQIKSVSDGITKMKGGLDQINAGLAQANNSNLSQVTAGIKGVSDGLGQTNDFLGEMSSLKAFYIPKAALTNKDFQPAINMFMSKDRTITKLTVILDNDPYSKEAFATINKINAVVENTINGTAISNSQYGISGPSATTNDMNKMLSDDLSRMTIIVLIGVFLILVLVIKSFWLPLLISISLLGTYYASMFAINFIFINIIGLAGISSFVPFFSFIIIVALGVDYSIFLMMRYKEYPNMTPIEAIVLASKNVGGIVMSAVVILGGTFLTLMPSGIILLSEMATAVIVGLLVLCLVMLPFFIPATISLITKIKEFMTKKKKENI